LTSLVLLAFGLGLGALGFLHHELDWVRALLSGLFGLGVARVLRSAWAGLPNFVAGWLEAGVVVAAVLVAAASTGVSQGIPYAVARSSELFALAGSAALAGTATASLAYTHHRLASFVGEATQRALTAENRALESQLAALSAQINPHFLFNTLNVLAELVHEDEDRAEDLITDLAAMMRYALRSSTTRVPLSEELDVIRRLLRIETARLGSRLRWEVEVEASAEAVLVPGLILQPLVENAVRHAVAPRPEGGSVRVEVTRQGERVQVVVSDDGPGLPAEVAGALLAPGRGTGAAGGGLRSVALRASLAWPTGQAGLQVREGPGTQLVLSFPGEAS
jgi:signal transduction histidine kinase